LTYNDTQVERIPDMETHYRAHKRLDGARRDVVGVARQLMNAFRRNAEDLQKELLVELDEALRQENRAFEEFYAVLTTKDQNND